MSSRKDQLMKGVCAPFVIGAILSISSVFTSKEADREKMIVSSVVSLAILYTLCYYGYKKTAWAFLLLPLLLMIPLIAIALGIYIDARSHEIKPIITYPSTKLIPSSLITPPQSGYIGRNCRSYKDCLPYGYEDLCCNGKCWIADPQIDDPTPPGCNP